MYRITPPLAQVVFDPQFSPDGQYILLKSGWPYDRRGVYKIYLWNLKTKKLQSGPEEMLSWRRIQWSPDSNYLAYVRGGDAEGFELDGRTAPLRVCIYSLKTGISRIVAQNRGVTAMTWTRQNTLLYTFWPEMTQELVNSATKLPAANPASASKDIEYQNTSKEARRSVQPSIYEIPAADGSPKEIIKDVYGPSHPLTKLGVTIPAPSPDGKWIAFLARMADEQSNQLNKNSTNDKLGDKDAMKPTQRGLSQIGLFLYNQVEQKRIFVNSFTTETEDFMRWTSDSKHLIIMKTKYAHAKGEARISLLDVYTRKSKELTVLQAQDVEMIERPRLQPQFQIMQMSKNNKWVFVKVSEAAERHDMFYTFSVSLQAIDIATGKVSLVARIENYENNSPGMDWLDESAAP